MISIVLAAALITTTNVPVAATQGSARTVDWSYVRTGLFPGFGGKFCKVCPNVASDGGKTAFLRYTHLLLTGCDVCYGKYVSKSTDGGVTWSVPKESKALPDVRERGMRAVTDGTPYYSRKCRRWFGLGFKSYFENDAEPMQEYRDGKPYQVPMLLDMDPETGDFTAARELPFPIPYKGCYPFGQIVEEEDGSLLVAFNVTPLEPANAKYRTVTVRYRFEGCDLKPTGTGEQIGDEKLTRGYCEPSLVCAGGRYYLTLRSDEAGCVSVSDDGLRFSAPKPWCWEDGRPIGNRNTQQHWVKLGTKLYLAYTRVTPTNGHVFRNRAPIFLAEVDTEKLCLKRKTERPVTPERGARSGNFCGAPGADGEYWIATAEWMQGLDRSKTTADNTIWLVRFKAVEPAKRRGALCLTFDDSKVEDWMKALPLFDRYGARATFFFFGDLGKRELDAMRVMQSYGHSVGLHGALSTYACRFVGKQGPTRYLRKEVIPQLKATYRECLEVENWAYPCSERSEETDKLLLPFFKRLRTGHLFGVIPSEKPLAAYDEAYVPMVEVSKRSVLFGTGFGSDRPGAGAYIAKALERAAERDEALVLYSHDITATPNGDAHDTSLQDLEIILRRAKELGVPAIGFDELPYSDIAPAKLSAFHFNLVEMAKQRGITLEEAARAAQSWGITGVELWFGADESATGAGARLVAAGLKPVSVVLIQDFVHTNDVGRAERALAYARRVGAPHVMVVPGSCREGEDRAAAWRALRPNLEDFLRRATRAGIRVGIEAADPGNAVLRSRRDLREAFAALPTLGHVLDTGNCAPWNDDLLESIAEFRPRIRHVHVKDRSAEDFRKAVPAGTGTIPVREAVADLVRGGYDGWITVECFGSTNVWEDLSRSAAYVRRCASVR